MNFSLLTNYLNQVDKNNFPDFRLLVYKDHKCIYDERFVADDVLPEETDKDMYYIFSASKVITCTAAMRLIQDGKLGLDDPVYKYLPEFKELYVNKNGERALAKNTLTVRHLFSMQGGFTYDLCHSEIRKIQEETKNKATTLEMMKGLSKMTLSFEPGENFQYSLCHDILAAVVEVASGKKFSEYLSEVIFTPLGMKDITLKTTPEVLKRMKQQYSVEQVTFTAIKKEATCPYILTENYECGGAGMITTAEDYIKFVDALACGSSETGYKVLDDEHLALMGQNLLSEKSLETYRANVSLKSGYGYGFGVRTMMEPEKSNSLTPIGEFGWDGAAGAFCLVDTKNHLSIYLAQHVLCSPYGASFHHAIKNLVYKCIND